MRLGRDDRRLPIKSPELCQLEVVELDVVGPDHRVAGVEVVKIS